MNIPPATPPCAKPTGATGFTLLEMLAAITILMVLAALFFPVAETLLAKAERAVCMGNLRSLRVAFGGYAEEGWPQLPEGVGLGTRAEEEWWVEKTGKDLGLSLRDWQCPTLRRKLRSLPERDRPLIHYLPTPFSGERNKANTAGWEKMPWFIEIGNPHGGGNLLVRQNGTVEPAPQ